MGQEQFWLTDEQFSRIAPHLPTDTRSKERVDDRRVISGIVHARENGSLAAARHSKLSWPRFRAMLARHPLPSALIVHQHNAS